MFFLTFYRKIYNNKVKYKYTTDETGSNQETHSGYELIVFPKYEIKNNDVKWIYQEEIYCINDKKEISLYNEEDEECFDFKPIGIDKKWCELYKKSNLKDLKNAEELCKGQ